MTTYTFNGLRTVLRNSDDAVLSVQAVTLELVTTGGAPSFSYTIDFLEPDDLPEVDLEVTNVVNARIGGADVLVAPSIDTELGRVQSSSQGTVDILALNQPGGASDTDFLFTLGGFDVATVANANNPVAAFQGLVNSITSIGAAPGGTTFGPSSTWAPEDIVAFASVTENDRILLDPSQAEDDNGDPILDVDAGAGNDTVIGNEFINEISGGAGNDSVEGNNGADILNGGNGNDVLRGGNQNDQVFGDLGGDMLFGGNGNDSGEGGNGNDTLFGGNGNDILRGGNQNDRILAERGTDTLFGGNGNDSLEGGNGNDRMFGGSGNDIMRGGNQNDRVFAERGTDTLFGGNGNDSLEGGNGNDRMFGGNGNDILRGGNQNDRVFGEAGNDRVFGGNGNDTVVGGAGNDTVSAGNGNDRIEGGIGSDTFIFSGNFGDDTIVDFGSGNMNVINLAGVGAITSFNDLVMNHLDQVGSNVVIDDDNGNTITLLEFNENDLSSDNFAF